MTQFCIEFKRIDAQGVNIRKGGMNANRLHAALTLIPRIQLLIANTWLYVCSIEIRSEQICVLVVLIVPTILRVTVTIVEAIRVGALIGSVGRNGSANTLPFGMAIREREDLPAGMYGHWSVDTTMRIKRGGKGIADAPDEVNASITAVVAWRRNIAA
jgi:hypothetical protein